MPIHRSEIHIHIPALTNELNAGNIVLLVCVLQRRIKGNGLPIDGFDPNHFKVFWIIHADTKFDVHMEF